MDDVKGPLDTVSQLYQQLDEKISESGGLENLFGLHRKFRAALEVITGTELVVLLSEIQRAKDALNRLQDEIIEIHALRQAFESRASFLGSSKLRGES
jgi:hypothetical protein